MSSLNILEKCCFLADIAAGNPTHYMMEQALAQAELDWRFLSFEIGESELAAALAGLEVLGFRGVKLAEAFQTPAIEMLGSLTDRARRAGSANCLMLEAGKLVGDDTFGAAFVEAVGGEKLVGGEVLVIGGGRSMRSIACAATAAGATRLYLAGDADGPPGDDGPLGELVTQVASVSPETEVDLLAIDDKVLHLPDEVSVVVFAPAADDETDRPVIDADDRVSQLTFVDTRLRGSTTGLLRFAAERGAAVIDGVDLAARDTALALELWTGLEFDRAPLREMAEEYLGV